MASSSSSSSSSSASGAPPVELASPLPASPAASPAASASTSGGSGVHIRNYSEKAVVVLGNTFKNKDILKGLGGKWNAKLVSPRLHARLCALPPPPLAPSLTVADADA